MIKKKKTGAERGVSGPAPKAPGKGPHMRMAWLLVPVGVCLLIGLLPVALGVRLFFFRAEDGIRDGRVTGVQTCALPISSPPSRSIAATSRRDPGNPSGCE